MRKSYLSFANFAYFIDKPYWSISVPNFAHFAYSLNFANYEKSHNSTLPNFADVIKKPYWSISVPNFAKSLNFAHYEKIHVSTLPNFAYLIKKPY